MRERADAPLQRFDLVHHDLRRLLHERAVGLVVARQHLFHGQPDRRQRILHFVRHLARQRLPARELAQVDQPLGALLELARHVVERLDGAPDLVVAARLRRARSDRPPRACDSPAVKLLDRAADAMRQVDQQRQRHQPEAGGEQDIGEQKPRCRSLLLHVRGQCAGVVRSRVPDDPCVRPLRLNRVEPDFRAASHQVIERIAIHAGGDEVLRLIAIRERFDGSRPLRTGLCRYTLLAPARRIGIAA